MQINYGKIVDVFNSVVFNRLGPASLLVSFSFNSILKIFPTSWNPNSFLWNTYKLLSFPFFSFLYRNYPWFYCLTTKNSPRSRKNKTQKTTQMLTLVWSTSWVLSLRIKHVFFLSSIELYSCVWAFPIMHCFYV